MKKQRKPSGKVIGLDGKPILVNENDKKEITQPRPHLADMLMLPKKFTPSRDIDGKMGFMAVDPKDDPTKDEIIMIIGKAYPELVSFVKEIDQLKQDYAGAVSTVHEMHKAAMGKEINPVKGLVEDVESLRLRYKKALDVLRNIAYSLTHANADQLRFNASKFIEDNERLEVLGNENNQPPSSGGPN